MSDGSHTWIPLAFLLVCLCPLGATVSVAGPLRLGDEALSVTVNDDARLSSLAVGRRELLVAGQTAGLSAYDVGEREGPFALRGHAERTKEGAKLTYACDELGLTVTCLAWSGPRHTLRFNLVVDDLRKTDRGLTLEFALPLGAEGWTWWDDPDTSRPIQAGQQYTSLTRLRELPGLPEFDNAANVADFGSYSWYPVAAVTGERGLGLAKPPRAAGLFRFGFDGKRGVLYAAYDFALGQDTKTPGHAEFSFVLFPLDAPQGFRGALAELYELWPEDFKSRVPDYGGWMPFQRLSRVQNVDEFGFAYQEGAPEPASDDVLGVSSFVYFHCAGESANILGYTRGNPLPPYEEQLAAVNSRVKQFTGLDKLWDVTGVQLPDGKINIRPESTYGHVFAQPCVHPDLPYGKFMAENLVSRVTADKVPTGIDGCYYDGIAVGLDYSREHFKIASHPLLWDARLKRPVAYNFFSSLEWAEKIANTVHPQQKLTMLNDSSMSSFSFAFPYIDVLGAEGGWANSEAEFLRARSYCYHKPFCTLLKTDYRQHPQAKIESYMRSCLALGHLFGFFDISPSGANPGSSYWEHPEWYDRDRELFRRYMPLCAELCRAGWEPVQLASTATPGVKLERFGGGRDGKATDLVYYTVRRESEAGGDSAVSLQVSDAVPCARGPKALAIDLLTGSTLLLSRGKVAVNVPPGEVGVVAIGSREAQVRRCLDRVSRLIEARQRYEKSLTATPGLGAWGRYMAGGEIDNQVAHTGRGSLRATLTEAEKSAGAVQEINLNQSKPEDLIVRGFSKAKDVSGGKDAGYSLYVDCYYHDGNKLYGQTVQFDPGTHDWQQGEVRIHPTATIAVLNLYCMFRGHTGTVWFDDISLTTAAEPDKNLLKDNGFERAITPIEDKAAVESNQRLDEVLRVVGRMSAVSLLHAGALVRAIEMARIVRATLLMKPLSPDGERSKRDAEDVLNLLQLALSVANGKSLEKPWPQRMTPPFPLSQPKQRTVQQSAQAAAQSRVPAETTVTVDSSYEGYGPEPLTDGRINPKTDDWAAVAWASADEAVEHWIQLNLPKPQQVAGVVIHWAYDNGAYFNSQKVIAEVLRDGKWSPVGVTEVNADKSGAKTTISFAPLEAQALRIRQPIGGGPANRPNIMWVSEVEVS